MVLCVTPLSPFAVDLPETFSCSRASQSFGSPVYRCLMRSYNSCRGELATSIFDRLFLFRPKIRKTLDQEHAAGSEQSMHVQANYSATVPVLKPAITHLEPGGVNVPVLKLQIKPGIYCRDRCPICSQRIRNAGVLERSTKQSEIPAANGASSIDTGRGAQDFESEGERSQ